MRFNNAADFPFMLDFETAERDVTVISAMTVNREVRFLKTQFCWAGWWESFPLG